ncbi:hypothetical protein TNCV_3411881 [Trichonephila clavipes]|nr:hypothetical protein TNCV_3411881 [Trichonephila clavipes]
MYSDDHQRRVWRRPGWQADSASTIVHQTGPQTGVMISKCGINSVASHTSHHISPNKFKDRTREAERDFCDLPIRRDEERVVDPLLVFKRVFLGDGERSPNLEREKKRKKPCPGSRELERRALRRLEWKGRKYDERRWR